MSEATEGHELDEHDLHALIDGEIAGPRAWAVLARLAANPEAAERAAAYARQRVALALLRESLRETDVTPRLAALGEALRRALGPLTCRAGRPSRASAARTVRTVRSSASGVTLIESMPQLDQELGHLRVVARRLAADADVAAVAPRALDRLASIVHARRGRARRSRTRTSSESRSTPSTSCVRSFEPIEKPSKSSANSSTRMTLVGISHMT